MCGIAGTFQIDPARSAAAPRIEAAVRRIAHRGPDDEGITRIGGAVLGHRRLSIIDTSTAGHQPFTDDNGRHTIVFNGEVFNFKELRHALEAKGHSFRSRTDTEVVLRLYTLQGPDFLHDLNGFFALAIHDRDRDELFIARDRFGVKPLWWCEHEGRLLFASELRALMELGAPRAIDPASLRQYLTHHFIPAPHAILNDARKLPPGHSLTADRAGIRVRRWYDLVSAAGATPPVTDPEAHLFDLMTDAVRLRLISDVPIGTFLSGGVDSSIVSALAKQHKPDLHTFSIGFPEDPYFDESAYAEEVARHIGSEHHTFRLTRDHLAAHYQELLDAIDEPFADSSALPSFILCGRTRAHVTVALSGDGGDEVFGGYRKHQAELRARAPGAVERAVIALGPLWKVLPRSRDNAPADAARMLHRFATIAGLSPEDRWRHLASFDPDGYAGLLLPRTAPPSEREHALTEGLRSMPGVNGVLLADVLGTLPNDMLHKVDLTSMAHALEVRTPFLDRRVVEFAFSLPAEVKFGKGTPKAILRRAFGRLLPERPFTRRKQGFEVPLLALLRGPLRPLLDTLLQDDLVDAAGLDRTAVRAVRSRLESRDPGLAQATVHALAVYLSWWKRWGAAPPSTM